jgi:hypothetical protein
VATFLVAILEFDSALASGACQASRDPDHIVEPVSGGPVAGSLPALGVPREALLRLARSVLAVTRLLKNNPRPVSEADAIAIYEAAF